MSDTTTAIERVYRYLAARATMCPDEVIDSFGPDKLNTSDLRAVLVEVRALREPGAPEWTTISPGWNWRFGRWTIDRRTTDRGTEFAVFHGTSIEEITNTVELGKQFVAAQIRRKADALDFELRRNDLDPDTRATLISARNDVLNGDA